MVITRINQLSFFIGNFKTKCIGMSELSHFFQVLLVYLELSDEASWLGACR